MESNQIPKPQSFVALKPTETRWRDLESCAMIHDSSDEEEEQEEEEEDSYFIKVFCTKLDLTDVLRKQ